VAVLGALLLVTSDFAGWYTRGSGLATSSSPSRTGSAAQNLFFSYTASESTDAVNIWGPYLPLLLVVIGLLAATAYLTLRTPPPTLALPLGAPLWAVPALAAAATLAFGLIFVIAMLIADPEDWWLDVGFFAGTIAGVVAAAMLRRERASTG
jgi:peptidoglycan/LPS O-acetylase OafA/YrhL